MLIVESKRVMGAFKAEQCKPQLQPVYPGPAYGGVLVAYDLILAAPHLKAVVL